VKTYIHARLRKEDRTLLDALKKSTGHSEAVKTIIIDMEAYRTLCRLKKPGQSFSQVIKEKLGPVKTGATFLAGLKQISISEDTLNAIEKVVRDRKKSPLTHPKL